MDVLGSIVLSRQHAPLLFASSLPAICLCVILRLNWLHRVTRGVTNHALFSSLYFVVVGCAFWIGAAVNGMANPESMSTLVMQGWLFPLQNSPSQDRVNGPPWNYWTLFDFTNVKWSALGAAAPNMALTIFAGVINLPIYIPALAQAVDVTQYSMNYELFGHGVANFFAGISGTVPNLVVRSSSKPFQVKMRLY